MPRQSSLSPRIVGLSIVSTKNVSGFGLRGSLKGPRQPLRDNRVQRRSRPSTGCGGAKKRGSESALGRSRGDLTTKIHLLADALGLPLGFVLTGGQTNDCTQAIALLGDRRPEAVLADKGYDTDPILNHLSERGIAAVIWTHKAK
jgi:hypothetical protein